MPQSKLYYHLEHLDPEVFVSLMLQHYRERGMQ